MDPGLTYRAYQSGQVIYRSHVTQKMHWWPITILRNRLNRLSLSPLAVLMAWWLVLFILPLIRLNAFSLADLRALRLLTRMLEELLATYQARLFVNGKLSDAIVQTQGRG